MIGIIHTQLCILCRGTNSKRIRKVFKNGGIYKGHRPVLWSVIEKTALADEVEYHDHKSTTIYACFPISKQ